MGCCLSCIENNKNNNEQQNETEMQSKKDSIDDETLCIARGMSAPTIEVNDRINISGYGLALSAVTIEQDSAYWEAHIKIDGDSSVDTLFGLSTKKDRKFYENLQDDNSMNIDDDENKKKLGLGFMSKLNVKNNDIIGIMIQQSNLPMIQFYINGIIQHQLSINRFRGTVYPSFYIPQNNNENNSIHIKVIFREKDFKQTIPNNCSPVIVARGLV